MLPTWWRRLWGQTTTQDEVEFPMKLIVGLGNPGRKYDETRHNIGFDVLRDLAMKYGDGSIRTRFQAETTDAIIDGQKVLLICPQTYMNKSGASVLAARDFYKIDRESILIVCDDFSLPVAKLRIRAKGSSGGQKGLQDILNRLGTQEVPRLRVGIGPPPPQWEVADYVLSKFKPDERETVQAAIKQASQAATTWVREGVQESMNQFNG